LAGCQSGFAARGFRAAPEEVFADAQDVHEETFTVST